ncbi:MAG: glycosyltransferase [Magnetococcales bacterium]|nr:glycosyltransferase [Magnetococcales bacterium]
MAKILILIAGPLSSAPRPQKEALALAAAGHAVTIFGVWSTTTGARHDFLLMRQGLWHFQPVVDLRPIGWRGRVTGSWLRLNTRLARTLHRRGGWFSPELLGYGVRRLRACALAERADLTIVHAEGGLWIAEQLRAAGLRVGVDFEDWFAEDLPEAARAQRPLARLRELEGSLLRHARYRLTTSHALAEALAARYGVAPPRVVYNVFPASDRAGLDHQSLDRRHGRQRVSLHWFSQSLGPGRGLELLFAALPRVRTPVEIHLRGETSPATHSWLEAQVPPDLRPHLYTHALVPNQALLSRIAEHDIGLSLDTPTIRSRDLTITNKLFQYLLAGLPVIATATRGQREILDAAPTAGRLVSANDPKELARAIDDLARDPARLVQHKAAALTLATTRYCWEQQAPVVVAAAEEALRQP